MKKKLLIIANYNIGTSQSGGDTIFLELIKYWQSKFEITVLGAQESKNLLIRYQLNNINFVKTDEVNIDSSPTVINLFKHTIRRIIMGIYTVLNNKELIKSSEYCYTVSDFYPDFILGIIYKILNQKGTWISGHYLFVPKPTDKQSPYEHEKLKGWLYYFSQIPSRYLGYKFADIIYVTSLPDVDRFPGKKVIVIRGGVDTTDAKKFLNSKKVVKKIYEGLFIGRLHPQKGVLEMVDIWKILCKKLPKAKLAIIGDGILNKQLITKIKTKKLQKNITLFGFQVGAKKYELIEKSKIILHPAIYDSGGMASADAMAFGLPGVSFDLPALKTYYPQGMIKTEIGNKQLFADNIYNLLTDSKHYNKTSNQALNLINNHWEWSSQAKSIYQQTFK